MKVFVFLVCLALFLSSFVFFALAFTLDTGIWQATTFFVGILAVSASLAIPFHALQRTD